MDAPSFRPGDHQGPSNPFHLRPPRPGGLKLSVETIVLRFELLLNGCFGPMFQSLALFGSFGVSFLRLGTLLSDVPLLLPSQQPTTIERIPKRVRPVKYIYKAA